MQLHTLETLRVCKHLFLHTLISLRGPMQAAEGDHRLNSPGAMLEGPSQSEDPGHLNAQTAISSGPHASLQFERPASRRRTPFQVICGRKV